MQRVRAQKSCQGVLFKIGITAGVQVKKWLRFYLASRDSIGTMIKKKRNVRAAKPRMVFARLAFTSPGKNRDKHIKHTDRVSIRYYLLLSGSTNFTRRMKFINI